jgi:hypothetical protein
MQDIRGLYMNIKCIQSTWTASKHYESAARINLPPETSGHSYGSHGSSRAVLSLVIFKL